MPAHPYSKTVWELTHIIGNTNAQILGVVWSFCSMSEGYCYASIETIGGKINLCRKTTWTGLKWLERHGYIIRERRDSQETDDIYCTKKAAQWFEDNASSTGAT